MFVAVLPLLVMAAPTFQNYASETGDVTIDSQWTGNWELVDSLIITASDTAYVLLRVTGTAYMNPWERLYLGFGNASGNVVDSATAATTGQTMGQTSTNLDTNLVKLHSSIKGGIYYPFVFEDMVSMEEAQVDTFYLNMSTGSDQEHVEVYNLMFSAEIIDR